jgi:ABC-type multidrug transport system ATPase subunit
MLEHSGKEKTTTMSMLTGKCYNITVNKRRLTMSMLTGNSTTQLGHNGAGKTTTMSMSTVKC